MYWKLYQRVTEPETGSQRFVFELEDSCLAESAIVYHKQEAHLCISTQVGCPIGCNHCATRYCSPRFIRNLTLRELVSMSQFLLSEADTDRGSLILSFSGHGEPLLNWSAVKKCATKLRGNVFCVYLTTVGIRKTLLFHVRKSSVPDVLYISLHGSCDAERSRIIPSNPQIMKCKEIIHFASDFVKNGRRAVLNYVATDFNTTTEAAMRLAELTSQVENSIEIRITHLNPVCAQTMLYSPSSEGIDNFANMLAKKCRKLKVRVSDTVGRTHNLACGQMKAGIL